MARVLVNRMISQYTSLLDDTPVIFSLEHSRELFTSPGFTGHSLSTVEILLRLVKCHEGS